MPRRSCGGRLLISASIRLGQDPTCVRDSRAVSGGPGWTGGIWKPLGEARMTLRPTLPRVVEGMIRWLPTRVSPSLCDGSWRARTERCQPSSSMICFFWVGSLVDLRFTAVEERVGRRHDLFLAHGAGNWCSVSTRYNIYQIEQERTVNRGNLPYIPVLQETGRHHFLVSRAGAGGRR